MTYAKGTSVSEQKSKMEIEALLKKYGADRFAYGWDEKNRALVEFGMKGKRIRFEIPIPVPSEFERTKKGQKRSASSALAAYEQAVREKWRALLLVVKAKLEAVENGVTTFEEEFLPHFVVPSRRGGPSRTVAQLLLPELDRAYATGHLPPLLPSGE